MAEVIRAWQDYLSQPLADSDASTDSSDLLALAVKQLIETLGTFSYDDILLRTQAVNCILFMLCVEFVMPRLGALSDDAVWRLSVWRQSRTSGRRARLWNDLYCVEWDVKP